MPHDKVYLYLFNCSIEQVLILPEDGPQKESSFFTQTMENVQKFNEIR
jgi:hypothetical protein